MADKTDSPAFTVADACMSFADAIIARKTLMDPDEARETGRDLYTWFDEQGGTVAKTAPYAVRSVDSGTNAIKTVKGQSVDDILDSIKADYQHYTDGI